MTLLLFPAIILAIFSNKILFYLSISRYFSTAKCEHILSALTLLHVLAVLANFLTRNSLGQRRMVVRLDGRRDTAQPLQVYLAVIVEPLACEEL